MARIRTVRPDFFASEPLSRVPAEARLLLIRATLDADDCGNLERRPALLRRNAFPFDEVRIADVDRWIDQLVGIGEMIDYFVDGSRYLHLPRFEREQRINRPSRPRYPAPPWSNLHPDNLDPASDPWEPAWDATLDQRAAARSGGIPGTATVANCARCETPGAVWWPLTDDAQPSPSVVFVGLEVDYSADSSDVAALTLSCGPCNRRDGIVATPVRRLA